MRSPTRLFEVTIAEMTIKESTNRGSQSATEPSPVNIAVLLADRVSATPTKPFLFSEADGRVFTYAEFDRAVSRAARRLVAAGVGKGDAVSLLMPNSVEYIIAYFACWKLGALAGPINSLLKAEEVAFVISDSEAKAIMVHSEFLPMVEGIRDRAAHLEIVIEFDDEAVATRGFVDKAGSRSTT